MRDPVSRLEGKTVSIVLPDLNGGGAERIGLTLANELFSRGIKTEFVLMQAQGDLIDQIPTGSKLVNLDVSRLRSVPLAMSTYLSRNQPDVVLANMWPLTSMCVIANQIAKRRTRMVVCEHNNLSMQYDVNGCFHHAMLRSSLATTFRAADAIICVSAGVADDLAKLAGIRRERISVVYNPITAVPFSGIEQEWAENAWRGFKGKRILSVGSFKLQKNQELLIRSFAHVAQTSDVRLMLLGDGELRRHFESLAQRLGIEDKILMPGFYKNPFPFYESADLFVLSSDYEGFGNVLVEAMACGTPVVSTNCMSGPAEILQGEAYGRLVPVRDETAMANAIQQSLGQSHDAEMLKRRANDFHPSKIIDNYLALLFP
jgi:glycosyltransferase involved in cell wall biosynthesis